MTMNYGSFNPLPANQTLSSGGKDVFKLDKWKQLERFLILGTEGGTYYVSEKKLTTQNIKSLDECIVEDWKRVLKLVCDISTSGRAPKNDPALYALAKLVLILAWKFVGLLTESFKMLRERERICFILPSILLIESVLCVGGVVACVVLLRDGIITDHLIV